MSDHKIVCVIPSIRPERMARFREAWGPLFEKHGVTLVTVWDGEKPSLDVDDFGKSAADVSSGANFGWGGNRETADLFCRFTDACRNMGFLYAASLKPDFVLTMDDDVEPVTDPTLMPKGWEVYDGKRINDPIQAHLDALSLRVPLSWMNTAHMGAEYLRGFPYGIRDEAPVMLSHGVWVGVPDFDGETQLRLEEAGGLPKSLPYYVGPVPRGVHFCLCGMNVMIRKEALPYFYFAPMGPDSGVEGLNRFADIWLGIHLKTEFDRLGWACYTGASTVLHTRASDAAKNFEQEKLGRKWIEQLGRLDHFPSLPPGHPAKAYFASYQDKRTRYADLIRSVQGES